MVVKHLVISVALGFNLLVVAAQSTKRNRPVVSASQISSPAPIVFGRREDGLPEKMAVRGTIVDLTFAEIGCGVIAWSGTVQVRLAQPIPEYPHTDVFIVVPCFPEFEKFKSRALYVGRPLALEVSKLYPEYQFGVVEDVRTVPCAFEIIVNRLNSKKVAFYCTKMNISESIETVENEQRKKQ